MIFRPALPVLAAALLGFGTANAGDLDDRVANSRVAANTLLNALKDRVTEVARAKGPVEAAKTCNLEALPMTKRISEEQGFQVGRTSHLLRQPKNAPDTWEQAGLDEFMKRKAAGEKLAGMERYEVVTEDGKPVFRYMRAIEMGGVCYNCHGKLRREVAKAIDEMYPNDKARDLNPGDLRGAFTIRQPM
ncbi:MAG: DUF3365 domain-containing protein [Chromatiales bacterium]|nr:DUF3365 domain-containing protein [Chromatiales bacterium]